MIQFEISIILMATIFLGLSIYGVLSTNAQTKNSKKIFSDKPLSKEENLDDILSRGLVDLAKTIERERASRAQKLSQIK